MTKTTKFVTGETQMKIELTEGEVKFILELLYSESRDGSIMTSGIKVLYRKIQTQYENSPDE